MKKFAYDIINSNSTFHQYAVVSTYAIFRFVKLYIWWSVCYLLQEVLRSGVFVSVFSSLLICVGPNISKTVGEWRQRVSSNGTPTGNSIWRIEWSHDWKSRWRPDGGLHSVSDWVLFAFPSPSYLLLPTGLRLPLAAHPIASGLATGWHHAL